MPNGRSPFRVTRFQPKTSIVRNLTLGSIICVAVICFYLHFRFLFEVFGLRPQLVVAGVRLIMRILVLLTLYWLCSSVSRRIPGLL